MIVAVETWTSDEEKSFAEWLRSRLHGKLYESVVSTTVTKSENVRYDIVATEIVVVFLVQNK